jgi:hypothetical protein
MFRPSLLRTHPAAYLLDGCVKRRVPTIEERRARVFNLDVRRDAASLDEHALRRLEVGDGVLE